VPIFNGLKSAFDRNKNSIVENRDEFQSFFEVLKLAAPVIGNVIGKALEVIGGIATVVLNVFAAVLGAIKPLINTAIDGINLVIKGLNLIKPGSDIAYLKPFESNASVGGFSGTLPNGTSFNTNYPVGGSSSGATTSGSTTTTSSSSVAAAANAGQVVNGVFNAGSFRAAESAASGNNYYNITVTGALDKEAVARQIVSIIQDSNARGTNGSTSLVSP
jgi:hypothetical protein